MVTPGAGRPPSDSTGPKLKRWHSFALFLATRGAYQAQLSAWKVLTFFERVLSLNELHNSSN